VFVSTFIVDLSRGLRRSDEANARLDWLRTWLVPTFEEVERRAGSTEAVGDSYVLYRLRHGQTIP
jgi:hypothetical protein